MNPNARFWQYINDAPVKLTLRPGQSFRWTTGGATDEGYHHEQQSWDYPDRPEPVVFSFVCTSSRDCDGRLDRDVYSSCPLAELASHEVEEPYTDYVLICGQLEEVRYPSWQDDGGSQRDYEAERAGY